MIQRPRPQKALLFSTLLHVVVLIILICSFEFSALPPVVSNDDKAVINAIALTDSPLLAPPSKLPEEKPVPKQELQQPPPVTQPPENTAINKPAPKPLPSQAPSAEKTLAVANEHQKAPLEQPQKVLLKKDLSKQLMADLEDELAKQSKAKQKQLKNKFSKELKAQSEKALQEMIKEQKPMAGRRSQHMQGIIDKFKAQIVQAIGQQWVVPSHVNKHLYCQLMIRLEPGGKVLDVEITKSSGDLGLDRSARAAVFKASPLPVPDDIISFEPFRQFVLKVKPENVMDNQGEKSFWLG